MHKSLSAFASAVVALYPVLARGDNDATAEWGKVGGWEIRLIGASATARDPGPNALPPIARKKVVEVTIHSEECQN